MGAYPPSRTTDKTISNKSEDKNLPQTSPHTQQQLEKLRGLRWGVEFRSGWSPWCVVDCDAPVGMRDVVDRFVSPQQALDRAFVLNGVFLPQA